ncbi:hypothetical protein BCR34DRAFT_224955 [Clohesyomyces aquaticus]|uniref:Uncharacterized protein n=1 Tax=Clohesyomyces aquaticus TaxID=1231657 RepID=A0A1Y1ZWS0_9PLEO|nr:hypothetical protein BCR34DRAFT_224955 [Clohesyomyces aquaticus]
MQAALRFVAAAVRARAESSLALLSTCKQIEQEATGIAYSGTHFIFYYLNRAMLLLELSAAPKAGIQNVTLWYKNHKEGGLDSLDVVLRMLWQQPVLKKLEVVLGFKEALKGRCAGLRQLWEIRAAGLNVVVRCMEVDVHFWEAPQGLDPGFRQAKKRVERLNKDLE